MCKKCEKKSLKITEKSYLRTTDPEPWHSSLEEDHSASRFPGHNFFLQCQLFNVFAAFAFYPTESEFSEFFYQSRKGDESGEGESDSRRNG